MTIVCFLPFLVSACLCVLYSIDLLYYKELLLYSFHKFRCHFRQKLVVVVKSISLMIRYCIFLI